MTPSHITPDAGTVIEGKETRGPRAGLVKIAVVCTGLIFAACATLLVYRGASVEVPDAVLIVRCSPKWDGAVVMVDGMRLARPSTFVIDRGTKYTISFHLMAGEYTLSVKKDGKTIFTRPVELTRRVRSEVVYLPNSLESLTPTSQPAWPFNFELPFATPKSPMPADGPSFPN